MQKFLEPKQSHVNYSTSAMETGDHSKNGASPKSHTNRGNFYNNKKMRATTKLLSIFGLIFFIVSCGGNTQTAQKSKQTDWEQLNLQGKVKSYTEKKEGQLSPTFYTVFNEMGYIIEKGKYDALFHEKKIKETREYDDNNNLIKTTEYSDDMYYQIYIYDNNGKLLEEQRWAKPIYGSHAKTDEMTVSDKYRYEPKGKNEENVYITAYSYGNQNKEQLAKNILYDKQGNIVWEMTYEKGEKKTLTEYAYDYDKHGNIIKKIEYAPLLVKDNNKEQQNNRDFRRQTIFVYQYDNAGLMIYHKISTIPEYFKGREDGREERILEEVNHKYDLDGNLIDYGATYEYDRNGNWIHKRERYSGHDIIREFEYFENTTELPTPAQSQSSGMSLYISDAEPCDGGSLILKVTGGTPFLGENPFVVESIHIDGVEGVVRLGKFIEKDGAYEMEIHVSGLDTSQQQLAVTDAKGNKTTINFTISICP